VIVLDTRGGRIVRTVPVGPQPGAIAVDDRTGRAFVLNPLQATVAVFATHSGTLLRTVSGGAGPHALAVDARRGRVFVATGSDLEALDAATGVRLSAVALGGYPGGVTVAERSDRVYIPVVPAFDAHGPLGLGHVSVLDARTGALVDTLPAGVGPLTVAVDERARRVLIVNSSGDMPVSDPWSWLPAPLQRALPFLPAPGPRTRRVPSSVTVLDLLAMTG